MAPKKAEKKLHQGVVMWGPDGKLYYVRQPERGKALKLMAVRQCEEAFKNLCECLEITNPQEVVLSGVMTRADCPVGRRSAKK